MSNLSSLPQITNEEYHLMSFGQIDEIRKKLNSGEDALNINKTQLMLYLNQMTKKHSFILKWIQNISIIGLIGFIPLLFFNWKLAIFSLIVGIGMGFIQQKKASEYIFRECLDDRVFLKFALSVGLVKIKEGK